MEDTKGLAVNHGYWPLSPDAGAKSSKIVAKNQAATDRLTRPVKPGNPSLTQPWQDAPLRQTPACDDDVERAFLVLEANIPKTKYYGSTGAKVHDADEIPRSRNIENNKSLGQRRSRSSSPMPRWARSGKYSHQFSRDTVSSILKNTSSEPHVYQHSSAEDLPKRIRKQLELEKIYKRKCILPGKSAKPNRRGVSRAHSAQRSVSAVLKKQKHQFVETRKSKSCGQRPNVVASKCEEENEASRRKDDRVITEDKKELPENIFPAAKVDPPPQKPWSAKSNVTAGHDTNCKLTTRNEKAAEKDFDRKPVPKVTLLKKEGLVNLLNYYSDFIFFFITLYLLIYFRKAAIRNLRFQPCLNQR